MYEELKNQRAFEVNDLPEEIRSLIGANRALIIPLKDDVKNEGDIAKEAIEKYVSKDNGAVKTLDFIGDQINKIEELVKNGEVIMLDNLIALYSLYDFAMLELNLIVNEEDPCIMISSTPMDEYYKDSNLVKAFIAKFNDFVYSRNGWELTNSFERKITYTNDGFYFTLVNLDVTKIDFDSGIVNYISACKKLDSPVWFKPIDDYLMYKLYSGEAGEYKNTYHLAKSRTYRIIEELYGNNRDGYLECMYNYYVGVVIEKDNNGKPLLIDKFNELFK